MLFPLPMAHTSHDVSLIWFFIRDKVLRLFFFSLVQLLATWMCVRQKLNLTKRDLITSKYTRCCVIRVVLDCLSECDITISHKIFSVRRSTPPILLISDTFRSPFTFQSHLIVPILSKHLLESRANLRTKTNCVYIWYWLILFKMGAKRV